MFDMRSIVCFFFILPVSQASHFRGGYISWQTVTPNTSNDSTITINIQQTYSWTYATYNCLSNVGDVAYLNCISTNCSNYPSNTVKIAAPCISSDSALDISTGQSITSVTLLAGAQFILAYRSNAWLPLVQSISLLYGLVTSIDLSVRTDDGRINSSPTATMTALVTVLVNVQQILRIPMADIDFDIVKCRWANKTSLIGNMIVDECQGACQNVPGAQLSTSSNGDNNCSLIFTTSIAGYYVVALQIEDFMPIAPNGPPLSSVPLQFIIHTLNISCNQPKVIGQLADGSTVQVEANSIFSISIIAQTGCNTTSINRFLTIIAPSGRTNTTAVTSLDSVIYSTTFIWTPTTDDIGTTQLFCIVAIDTNNLQSPQYCLNFVVIAVTTTTSTTTTSTTTTSTSSTTTSSTSSTSSTTTSITTSSTSSTTAAAATTTTLLTDRNPSHLGLILGLGIPLFMFGSILASCIACRWCQGELCKRFRQRFWDEKSTQCQSCQSPHCQESTITMKPIVNEGTRRYRQQYINESPTTPSNQSSYVDSLFPDSLSSCETNSILTSRTTSSLLSYYPNHTLPGVEIPTTTINLLQILPPSHGGSILIQSYFRQGGQNNYHF